MYSDISIRTMASSVSKRFLAKALANSVLPTPVGPKKMKLAVGRSGSESPARERCIASDTAVTASSCPITFSCSSSSKCNSFSFSDSTNLRIGIPVHLEIISAISDSITSSLSKVFPVVCRSSILLSNSLTCPCKSVSLP